MCILQISLGTKLRSRLEMCWDGGFCVRRNWMWCRGPVWSIPVWMRLYLRVGVGMMVNLSTELLIAALQGFELMIFRSRCRRSHISSAGTYIRRQVFWTLPCAPSYFFFCVDILKTFFERQMQTYFGGRIQLKRVQARVQLRLYQKVNLRL